MDAAQSKPLLLQTEVWHREEVPLPRAPLCVCSVRAGGPCWALCAVWMDGWMDGCVGGRMMDGWMGGLMNG